MRSHSLTRIVVILGGITVMAVAMTWVVSVVFFPLQPTVWSPHQPFPLPPISLSPYRNTSLDAQYIGSKSCAECHPDEAITYRLTGHSLALADAVPGKEPSGGAFLHEATGRLYEVFEQTGKIHHRESLRTADNIAVATAEFPVRFLVGSGRHTRSYLVEDNGFLIQSPVTWYASTKSWGMSPGYDNASHWGFGRMVGTECLTCHVGMLDAPQQQYRGIGITEQAIGCERCHGPGSLHAQRHREFPSWKGEDLTIVQPALLSRSLSEDVCAQCHLQSAAMIRVRGRSYLEFRPGLPLTDFWIDYQTDGDNTGMTVTGHIEQMRQSRCHQQSQLTCITCHSMHQPPEDKAEYYKQKCLQCHAPEHCKRESELRDAKSPPGSCIDCHMPTSRTEIPHVAFTHHRIAVHRDASPEPDHSDQNLVPVQDTSHLPSIERERCLGLAYLQFSEKDETAGNGSRARQKARELLTSVYDRGLQDGETLAALAKLFAEQNEDVAEELATRAIASADVSVALRSEALFTLADIHFKAQRWQKAERLLKELVVLRRIYEDWFLLGSCQYLNGNPTQAIETFGQARSIDPFRPEVHQLLSRCYLQIGEHAKASHHQSLQRALEDSSVPTIQPRSSDTK